jgi:hypothetical protein
MYVRTARTAEDDIAKKRKRLLATDAEDRFTLSFDPVRASRAARLTEEDLDEVLDIYSPWRSTSSYTFSGHQCHDSGVLDSTVNHDSVTPTPYTWSVSITPSIPNGQTEELDELLKNAKDTSNIKFKPTDWKNLKELTKMPDISEQNLSWTKDSEGKKRRYGVFEVHSVAGKATRSVVWTQIVPGIWSAASDINGADSVEDDAECHVRLTVPDTDSTGQSPRSLSSMKSHKPYRQNSRKDSMSPTLYSSPIEEEKE